MKNLVKYLRHPADEKSARPRDIIVATVLYFVIPPAVFILLFFLYDKLPLGTTSGQFKSSHFNAFGLFVSVILEELAFRLPLKDKHACRIVSSLALSALLARLFLAPFCRTVLACIAIIVLLAALIYLLQMLLHKYLNFPSIFYLSAVVFGLLHLVRLDFGAICFASILYGLFYCFDKFLGGILLGYLRVQANIYLVIIIHLLYDFAPFALEHALNMIV